MPSPFELGGRIGGGLSSGIRQSAETSAIDQILQQANASGNPEDIQNVMGQILQRVAPERQQLAAQILQQKQAQLEARRSQESQAQAYQAQGLEPSLASLDVGVQKEILKRQGAKADKQRAYETSMTLLNRAEEISKTGHLGSKVGIGGTGRKFGSTYSAEGRKLRAEYQQIGKALVQAAAPLKITNRTEFEHYAADLEDPTRTIEEIQGSLAALKLIIQASSGLTPGQQQQPMQQQANQPKKRSLEEIFG